MPGWATWRVGSVGLGLLLSRLSFVLVRSRNDWRDLAVAGSLVDVSTRTSVIRLECSYALRDSRAWMSSLLK